MNLKSMLARFTFFLLINFIGLGLGSIYTEEVSGTWYAGLEKAPWTPPGWVFGAAWTLIMVCFSWFMARSFNYYSGSMRKEIILLFTISCIFNVAWNPLFFELHWTAIALIVIGLLLLFVFRFFQMAWRDMKWEWVLVLPYLIWMIIATSLNAYILVKN